MKNVYKKLMFCLMSLLGAVNGLNGAVRSNAEERFWCERLENHAKDPVKCTNNRKFHLQNLIDSARIQMEREFASITSITVASRLNLENIEKLVKACAKVEKSIKNNLEKCYGKNKRDLSFKEMVYVEIACSLSDLYDVVELVIRKMDSLDEKKITNFLWRIQDLTFTSIVEVGSILCGLDSKENGLEDLRSICDAVSALRQWLEGVLLRSRRLERSILFAPLIS